MNQPPSEILSQAADLLRVRKLDEARALLAGFLRESPKSDAGWWLMSFAVTDRDQKVSCLERVLKLNPNHHKAQKKLDKLAGTPEPGITLASDKAENYPAVEGLSVKTLAIVGGFALAAIVTIAFFAFQIFTSQVDMPEQAVIPQIMESTSMPGANKSLLPPTWTSTPTSPPPATRTPLPRTEIPIPTETLTPDPNATSTPIPENKIGTGNGQYPPDFTLVDALTGSEISLSDYGDQPVIIIFLTTWCTYCVKEMPAVQSVYEKYHDQGVVVLGIGIGASQAALRNYASRLSLNFPLLSDWDRKVAGEYEAHYIPTNYVIRKNGKIWQVSVGMMSEKELETAVTQAMKVP